MPKDPTKSGDKEKFGDKSLLARQSSAFLHREKTTVSRQNILVCITTTSAIDSSSSSKMTAASDHEIETSHQPIAAEDNEHGQQAPRFKQKHRIMLLFVIAVQVGMLGFDFVLSRKQQQQSSASAPSSMTSPDTKQQRLLFNPKNDEQEYRLTAQNNGKGHVRENRNKPQENKLLRELMPKSTKAPSIDSKAPSIKATKAPSVKESKAPSIKATKAPSIKSTKSGDEPSASAAPTGTPTSSPTTIEGATTADFETTDASGEIEI